MDILILILIFINNPYFASSYSDVSFMSHNMTAGNSDLVTSLVFKPFRRTGASSEVDIVSEYKLKHGRARRNIFKDIKTLPDCEKKAREAIANAKLQFEIVNRDFPGRYSVEIYNKAMQEYVEAIAAYERKNYLKAKIKAERALEYTGN